MAEMLQLDKALPVGGVEKKSTTWWGIWMLIATEGSLFGYLLISYYYLYFQVAAAWPPEGKPKLFWGTFNTFLLLTSSVFVWWSERGIKHHYKRVWQCILMGIAIGLGVVFMVVQLREWNHKPYGISSNLYGSLYFTITGFHMMHVAVGLVVLSFLLLWTGIGYFDEKRHLPVTVGGLYWHFVDVVWLFIYSSLYLFPYISIPWR